MLLIKTVIEYMDIGLVRNVYQERLLPSTVYRLSLQTLQFNEVLACHHNCEIRIKRK